MLTDLSLSMLLTISLGYMFLGFQINEYIWYSSFHLSTAFGSVFYLLTALHGLHVYIGILSFSVSYILFTTSSFFYRYKTFYFKYLNIFSVFSIWYWHFVDVVWVFLFLVVYIWSN
jgi:heme/copper-type cytochrome/quinol oxidase subunit 3